MQSPTKNEHTLINVNENIIRNMFKFPNFQKPIPIGYFSLNEERKFLNDASQLRYYVPPNLSRLPMDLNDGYSKAKHKPKSADDEGLFNLFLFIMNNKEKLIDFNPTNRGRPKLRSEFVCWRGLLTKIMNTPYEYMEDWCIHISRFNGTFYMVNVKTPEDKKNDEMRSDKQKRMCSWGFKFEQYCLSDQPHTVPKIDEPVDECSEFVCAFQTKIDNLGFLYGAEMDGINSETPIKTDPIKDLSSLKFIELKTQLYPLTKKVFETYSRHKTRKWWCQSFLVGIEEMYIGKRDYNGVVNDVENCKVRSLSKIAKESWNPAVCCNFLVYFLQQVRNVMEYVDSTQLVYEFYYDKVESRIKYSILPTELNKNVVPQFYTNLFVPNKNSLVRHIPNDMYSKAKISELDTNNSV